MSRVRFLFLISVFFLLFHIRQGTFARGAVGPYKNSKRIFAPGGRDAVYINIHIGRFLLTWTTQRVK